MKKRIGVLTYVVMYEGIKVYESRWMRKGAGLALPGIGIIVSSGAYSLSRNTVLLKHEFGHILQARKIGTIPFYFKIGIPSLFSAIRNGKRGHKHHGFWTEIDADRLADEYFS